MIWRGGAGMLNRALHWRQPHTIQVIHQHLATVSRAENGMPKASLDCQIAQAQPLTGHHHGAAVLAHRLAHPLAISGR